MQREAAQLTVNELRARSRRTQMVTLTEQGRAARRPAALESRTHEDPSVLEARAFNSALQRLHTLADSVKIVHIPTQRLHHICIRTCHHLAALQGSRSEPCLSKRSICSIFVLSCVTTPIAAGAA